PARGVHHQHPVIDLHRHPVEAARRAPRAVEAVMVEHRTGVGLEPAARIAIEHLGPELWLPTVETDRLGIVGDDENVEALRERDAPASGLRDRSDGDPTTPEAEPTEDRIRGGSERDEPDDRTGEHVQPDERLPPC